MRMLVVHPGASWATHDVHVGLVEGLKDSGVSVCEWRLDGRIERSHGFLHYLWRQQRRKDKTRNWPKPTAGDVLYQASQGIVERAIEKNCRDVLIVSAMYMLPERIELMKRAGLRVWLLCTETPYDIEAELRIAALCHGVWTHERSQISTFRQVQPNTNYLPSAWRKGTHTPVEAEKNCDVFFCGSLFDERVDYLSRIDWSGIDFHLYGEPIDRAKGKLDAYLKGGIISNETMRDYAQRARIVLNLFRAPKNEYAAESLNPRVYEMAAAGVCMVSDYRTELVDKFGSAVPAFHSPEEAGKVIRDLLADPGRREQNITNAIAAVADDHWHSRSSQVVADIYQWSLKPCPSITDDQARCSSPQLQQVPQRTSSTSLSGPLTLTLARQT